MDNLEKEALFLKTSSEQNDKAIISQIGRQSIKITLPCGCSQVQNLFCGKSKSPEWQSVRMQWFEFCKSHSTIQSNDPKTTKKNS